jgi:ABC-type amino acid transport substrate-binding protein
MTWIDSNSFRKLEALMTKPLLIPLILLILTCNISKAQDVDDLQILTESYPPFNYMEDGVVVGTATEYLVEILKRLHSKLTREDIKLVPWARAYSETLQNKNTIVYNIGRTEEREDLFKWVCPVGHGQLALIGQKRLKIRTVDDLKHYKIGVIREDLGHQLTRQLLPNQKLDIANSSESNLRKLFDGRIDLFAYEINAFNIAVHNHGINPNTFKPHYILQTLPLCIGFNKNADPELVNSFQEALDAILQKGTALGN